jgi:hypothetical protein
MGTSSSSLNQRLNAAAGGCTSCGVSGGGGGANNSAAAVAAAVHGASVLAAAGGGAAVPSALLPASTVFAAALAEANAKRALHGSPPLTLALGAPEQVAMANAAAIATAFQNSGCKTLSHTSNTGTGPDMPKVGQNIYAVTLGGNSYDTQSFGELLVAGVDMWYDEINGSPQSPGPYFDSAGKPFTTTFDSARGHFTQLVWKSSSQVSFGVATATCGAAPWLIFVANFTAPGNVISPATLYEENVLPPL